MEAAGREGWELGLPRCILPMFVFGRVPKIVESRWWNVMADGGMKVV